MAFAANVGPHISPALAATCPNPNELGVGGACWLPYLVSVLAFAVLAVLLTIAGLREQVWLQVGLFHAVFCRVLVLCGITNLIASHNLHHIPPPPDHPPPPPPPLHTHTCTHTHQKLTMTGFRILLALVMIISVAADPSLSMFPDVPAAPPPRANAASSGGITLAHFRQFLQTLPLCVYALNTSAVISSVLQETADRTKARSIFGSVIAFLALIYAAVGLVIAVTFQANGKEVFANSSLLWNSYGGANAPWWALIIRCKCAHHTRMTA